MDLKAVRKDLEDLRSEISQYNRVLLEQGKERKNLTHKSYTLPYRSMQLQDRYEEVRATYYVGLAFNGCFYFAFEFCIDDRRGMNLYIRKSSYVHYSNEQNEYIYSPDYSSGVDKLSLDDFCATNEYKNDPWLAKIKKIWIMNGCCK